MGEDLRGAILRATLATVLSMVAYRSTMAIIDRFKNAPSSRKKIEDMIGRKIPHLTPAEQKIAQSLLDDDREDVEGGLDSVGGNAEAKARLRSLLILPHERPDLYASSKLLQNASGILLHGPPGTGKTMMVRAVARELGIPFLCVRASTIRSMWFGESEQSVAAVFSLAAKINPCVVFFDEIDGMLPRRDSQGPSENLTAGIMSELLSCWDGAEPGIVVVAATNRPQALDPAIHRRLPRQIAVPLPDARDREEILAIVLSNGSSIEWSEGTDLGQVARSTQGYSGSELRELCVVAAQEALARAIQSETGPAKSSKTKKSDTAGDDDRLDVDVRAAMSLTTSDLLDARSMVRPSSSSTAHHRSWLT